MPKVTKQWKYDVLGCFFRVYFRVDKTASTLKDAIYNLYEKMIAPDLRLARNAMYRYMWKYYRNSQITLFQKDYRDYVRGLRIMVWTNDQQIIEGTTEQKDIENLYNCSSVKYLSEGKDQPVQISLEQLFGFKPEEIMVSAKRVNMDELHNFDNDDDSTGPRDGTNTNIINNTNVSELEQAQLKEVQYGGQTPATSTNQQTSGVLQEHGVGIDWNDILNSVSKLEHSLQQINEGVLGLKSIISDKYLQSAVHTSPE